MDVSGSADVLDKIESKKNEAERFARKYKAREMSDLEEYYKGASWAFGYAINVIREEGEQEAEEDQ